MTTVMTLSLVGNGAVVRTYLGKRDKLSTANNLVLVLSIFELLMGDVIHAYVILKHVKYFSVPTNVGRPIEYLTHCMLAIHLGIMTNMALDCYSVICLPSHCQYSPVFKRGRTDYFPFKQNRETAPANYVA